MKLKREIKSLFSVRESLRAKVALGVTLPLILLLGSFTAVEHIRNQVNNYETLSLFTAQIGRIIESNLYHHMLESDFEGIQSLLVTIGDLEEVEGVYLLNTEGKVIFASDENKLGTFMNHDNRPDCASCHAVPVESRPKNAIVNLNETSFFRSVQIIENAPECAKCHKEDGEYLGLVITDVSIAPYVSKLSAQLRENFIWWGSALLITLFVVRLVVSRTVLERLENLSSAISNFGKGKFDFLFVENRPDEIGKINNTFNEMSHLVESRSREIQQLSHNLQIESAHRGELLKRVITAQEDERRRVARDLHDDLGQSLSGLALHAKLLSRIIEDNPEGLGYLNQIEDLINETTEKMHDMVLDLRPSVLDDLGLVPALNALAERIFQVQGATYSFESHGMSNRLSPELETALYRTFQEALNNIVRHSKATRVEISLNRDTRFFRGEIYDNGQGFDLDTIDLSGDNSRGLGILGMRERIANCGGTVDIETHPWQGTRVIIQIRL